MKKKLTTEIWVEKAIKVHGDTFDYSKVEYNGQFEKVLLKCNKCGYEFLKTPKRHLIGDGCKNCNTLKQRKGTDQFIKEAKEKHGNKYNYSLVDYKTAFDKVILICPIHGKFEIEPKGHVHRGDGCWECSVNHRIDNLRKSVEDFIIEANIKHNNVYDYSLVKYLNKVSSYLYPILKYHVHNNTVSFIASRNAASVSALVWRYSNRSNTSFAVSWFSNFLHQTIYLTSLSSNAPYIDSVKNKVIQDFIFFCRFFRNFALSPVYQQ